MNLPELADLVALNGVAQPLGLSAHRPALAQLQGAHRSVQRGRGLEFEEVRLYSAGDDVRHIDWRVTARHGKMHTKLFREERERPVWLVLDLHGGLFFGSQRQLKSTLVIRAAAMLAWVGARGGDRVGAVISSGQRIPRIFQPRPRQAGVLPILEYMIEIQPREPGVPDADGLFNSLSALLPLLQPGSQVLLLSDFAGIDRATEDLITNVAARSDCRMMWVTDALEETGLPHGTYYLGVPGHLKYMNGEQCRRIWIKAWQEREQQLTDLAARNNFPLHRLDTSDSVEDRMNTLLREPRWAA